MEISLPGLLLLGLVLAVGWLLGAAAERRRPEGDIWASAHDRALDDEAVPAELFVTRMLAAVLTPVRLAGQLADALAEPITVGPVRRAGLATVLGTGTVTHVTAAFDVDTPADVVHDVVIGLDLEAHVQLPGMGVTYTGTADVRLATIARLVEPLTVLIDVRQVRAHDVDVRLSPTSRSSAAIRALAPLGRIAAGVIAETVNELAIGDELTEVRTVDLRPLLDVAWAEHAAAVSAGRAASRRQPAPA